MVWRSIDAHAIRHHATLKGRPPHLSGIRREVLRYLHVGRYFVKRGLPVVLPDLTNMMRLADLLVVVVPWAPDPVEFKGNLILLPPRIAAYVDRMSRDLGTLVRVDREPLFRGRAARQIEQIIARTRYLEDDHGHLPGDDADRMAFTTNVEPKYIFPAVDDVVAAALASGYASVRYSPEHAIAACSIEQEPDDVMVHFRHLADGMRMPTFGMNLRPHDELWWVVPPATEWPLQSEGAWALMEGEMRIMHLVDLAAIENYSTGRVQFRAENTVENIPSIHARIDGVEVSLGPKCVWESLYGFEHLHSVAARVADFLGQISDRGELADAT